MKKLIIILFFILFFSSGVYASDQLNEICLEGYQDCYIECFDLYGDTINCVICIQNGCINNYNQCYKESRLIPNSGEIEMDIVDSTNDSFVLLDILNYGCFIDILN